MNTAVVQHALEKTLYLEHCHPTIFSSRPFPSPRPPPTARHLPHRTRRLPHLLPSLPHALHDSPPRLLRILGILAHFLPQLVHHVARLALLLFNRVAKLRLQVRQLERLCVLLVDGLELEPGVVCDLVCEEGDEEGLEDGVGEGFVVCALETVG